MQRCKRRTLASLPVAVALAALTACTPPLGTAPAGPVVAAGSGTAAPAAAGEYRSVMLKGRAFAGEPVVGGTIRVEDLAGKVLLEAPAKTGASGTFAFDAPTLSDLDIRVVVAGGTLGGAPFAGTLMCEIAKFHGGLHLAYANPATTVAARHRAAAGVAIADAAKATQAYFGLPPTMSLGADVDNPRQVLFSEPTFMRLAGQNGGLDAYTAAVAADVAKGGSTKQFAPSKYEVQQLLGAIAGGIGNGILGAIGGAAFNAFLGAVGLDAAANQRQAILDEVRAVSAKIDQLSADVHAIAAEVHQTRLAIASLDTKVGQLQASVNRLAWNSARQDALTNYNNAEDTMTPAIAAIDAAWEQYNWLLDHASEVNAAQLDDFRRTYSPSTIRTHMTTVHMAATGGGTPGVTRWMRAYGFQAMVDGRYPYMVDEKYFNGALAMPMNVDAVLTMGTRLVKELETAQQFQGQTPTGPVAAATQADDVYVQRANALKALLWYGDLAPQRYTTVVGSPLKGLIWASRPVDVQATFNFNGRSYSTRGYGYYDTANFNPAPTGVAPTTDADGVAAGWRWPTYEEAEALGKTIDDRSVLGISQHGFDLSALPAAPNGTINNGLMGIFGLWTSSIYNNNPRFPIGMNISTEDNGWMGGPQVLWVADPTVPSAMVYIPVKKLRDEPVAREFAAF